MPTSVDAAGSRPVETGPPGGDPLALARQALLVAELADQPAERFLAAHLAALRVAAVVLAARGRPAAGVLREVWPLLAERAPEFAEWAGFFAATALKRRAVAAGATALVGAREADDLVRDAGLFYAAVAKRVVTRERAADREATNGVAELRAGHG